MHHKLAKPIVKGIKHCRKIWCQNTACLESVKQYKNSQELTKHIIKSHPCSSLKSPVMHTKVLEYENESVEFKSNFASCSKDKICQTICAMSNCLGGTIYFGITDDRVIYGVTNNSDWDKYMLVIANNLKYFTEPTLPYIKGGYRILNKNYSLFWIKVLKNDYDSKILYKEQQYIRCLSSNQLIENTVECYADLMARNKKLKEKLEKKQQIIEEYNQEIEELNVELKIKDEYIKNILKKI